MPSTSASPPHDKRASRRPGRARSNGPQHRNRWSADVMQKSDALDLEPHIFQSDDPAEIAASLKRSAEHSRRRKATPFQSAMSMLNFYVNRAGRNLPKTRRATLERAKRKLREAFGRKP
ncbi:TPA: DUF3175 domain-containing protein [Burkholderia vietnamiensis]|uniref:DUF3175 domain-containing protein n=1 Tax=Burkholderia vietnamiensis TaxID=60552 RepID=A0A132E0M7_BURVI|nr:DUF3175 domain-containing protein [Burkholderia vietnamiensis]KVF80584.1 hypothetical protein WJ18_12730 [Burkholderia vietnamiensis]KVF85768.1 hypothetical protein WJ19_16085 [Burkholderia vietnamiensis]KVF94388.1 hypothetical protein WJ20_04700 [Burkholderia vietnamiensis]KVF98344.1 hypothetical protein WJ22_22100 [Burkholderia vietnamiensis]KVR87599.1 hypothetical protein WK28_27090 [Burkholderia vietnamiensis]